MSNNFKDDKITVIKNDLKRIIARPGMYISSLGSAGVFHLCKEIIDNVRDECYKKESPGDSIYLEITDRYLLARDNGRGIPTDLVRIVHETIQAGSNMTRDGGATAGENGTGTSTYTAMAKHLEVISLRPTEKKKLTLIYEDGELKDEKCEKYTGTDHGLITKFYPSKKVLGTDEIPVDDLVALIEDYNYTLPSSIKLTYNVNGKEKTIKHVPLELYFDDIIKADQRMSKPFVIKCKGNLDEIIMEKKYKRKFEVEATLLYSAASYKGDDIRKSWMNMIGTIQNGSHVNGVLNGFSSYVIEKVVKKNKRLADEDLKRDVESHLHIVVKATADMAHMFSAQAKGTVFSKALGNAIARAVYDAMSKMNQSDIDDLVDIVIANNRVRKEGEKARDVSKLTRETKAWTKPDSFYPCSSAKTEQGKELFLVEGLSAGGGLRPARDARYQAILAFRGKSLNIWDVPIAEVLKSVPWLNLVKVLGTGVGTLFNIKKCNYEKIIIATDADIDGYHIRTLFLIFFFKFMPEIIENGMLYVAEPPLYQLLRNKELIYVADQQEYIEACIDSLGDIEIEFPER